MKVKFTLTIVVCVMGIALSAQPPANYYNNAAGKSCATLKTALKTIITTGFTQKSYSDLWGQYLLTDIKPREVGTGSANVIWDVYSDVPGPANDNYNFTPGNGSGGQQDQGSGGTSEGQFYNREHSVPRSWFGGGTTGPGADYLHIFPTDKYVNGKRGDIPYGEVSSASQTFLNGTKVGPSRVAGITGNVFEPIDSMKGDLARSFLYFVTRYEDNMTTYGNIALAAQAFEPNTFPSIDIPFLQLMIKWHNLDPVSQKELSRNNGSYNFQKNRNPYVDHPEYVGLVWNNTCTGLSTLPVDLIYFGGKLNGETVRLEWIAGTEISLDNYTIERSYNGVTYSSIGAVKAINQRNYFFTDNATENRGRQLYYRLKKQDKDGKFAYSQVVTVRVPLNIKFSVYPNPATTYMQLQVNNNASIPAEISIADITGHVVESKSLMLNNGNLRLSTANLSNGVYFVTLTCGGQKYMQKVVVMK